MPQEPHSGESCEVDIASKSPPTMSVADVFAVVRGFQYVRPYESESVYRIRKECHKCMPDAEVLAHMFPKRQDEDGFRSSVARWKREIDAGRVKAIPATQGDFRQLQITRHVHEQPVVAAECTVIHEDDKLLVVNKPAGMPTINEIQGVGFNTVLGVMQHRLNKHSACNLSRSRCRLIPMHRLDKPVSGVLLFVKIIEGKQVRDPLVRKIQKHITQHKVQKTYVARVLGAFPEDPTTCTAPLLWCDGTDRGTASVSQESGKACETRFSLIRREGTTSLVKCIPVTGRPHQIRAHLQHLGHPIANDEVRWKNRPA